jgi:hypothetical protein
MSQKSSGDYGDLRGVLFIQIVAENIFALMENKLKEYKHIWRIRQEYFDVLYMESTLIDLKLSLSRRILEKIKFGL